MENILVGYNKFDAYNEVYEVVKTVEVVGRDRNIYRIEVLKCYSNPHTPYTVEYSTLEDATVQPTYPMKEDKFEKKPESIRIWKHASLPSVNMQTPEDALNQALNFLAQQAKYPA